MPIIQPIANRRIRRSQSNDSVELRYVIYDTTDQSVAHNTLDATSPPTALGNNGKVLYLEYTETDPDDAAENVFYGTAVYSERTKERMRETPQTGDAEFSMDITGTSFRLQQSYNTTRYSASGLNPTDIPNFQGAINVQDDKVEGVDILIPSTKYTETHYLSAATVTTSYVDSLSQIVGKTNSATWRGFTANRLLLLGVSLRQRGAEDWQAQFNFALGRHEASLTVGGIPGVTKLAHDYVWVLYDIEEDTTAKRLKKTPVGIYVEQVYQEADFTLLGIGT